MTTIALLTDFGWSNFVGVMKGVILSINPGVHIVDIAHNITPQNIKEGGFLLYTSYKYFPKKTIFLAVVDPGVGSERKALAIETSKYYFLGPDNGILSLAVKEDGIKKIVILENNRYFLKNISSTFHGRDIFAPVASYISKGVSIANFGREVKKIKEIFIDFPKIEKNRLIAEVIYKDRFGNLITNLKKDDFLKFINTKKFVAYIKNKKINEICKFYAQGKQNKPFFIEGSSSFLEVSVKNKDAAKYFNIKSNEKVEIFIYPL